MGYVIGLIIAVVVLYSIIEYNRLVALRVRSQNAWSDIDVQLKRRHELVPNLVATVQGYATHEETIFEDVSRLRSEAISAPDPTASAEAEGGLASAIKTVFAIAEAYPNLKADSNFRKLQDQLAEVENALQSARRYYNAVVRDFNTLTEAIPSSLIASAGNFRRLAYFQAEEEARQNPKFTLTQQ